MTFQKVEPFSITTTDTVKSDSPNKKIVNPLKKDIFVNGIELLLSPEFSKKGKLLILVNDVSIFENKTGELVRYSKYPIPIGKVLKRSNNIQIFAWNDEDSNTIKVTGNIFLAEDKQPFNSQAEALTQADSNRAVSPSEIVFPVLARLPASFVKLIDLDGHKAMIVSISKTSPQSTLVFLRNEGSWTQTATMTNALDNDLDSVTAPSHQVDSGNTASVILDFGSIAIRRPTFKINKTNAGAHNWEIFTSDDDISYNSKASGSHSGTGIHRENGTTHSFRYLKIEFSSATASSFGWREIFDALLLGGIGTVTFEVRNPADDTWSTYKTVSPSIEDADASVIQLISGNLPSSQTDFRIKYSITVDALTNSVSIIKVTEQ